MGLLIFLVVVFLGFSLYDYFDARDWQAMTSAGRNNVVFELRNKKYGAYTLRRDYNDLMINLIIGLSVFITIISIANETFRSATPVMLPEVKMDTTELTLLAPPMEPIETVKTPYEIVGPTGGGAAGSPSNAPIDMTPKPMVKKEDVIKEESTSHVKSGQGNATTGDNKDTKPSSKNPSPFSGTGGKNGDKGQGTFGDDEGVGSGKGNGLNGSGGFGRNGSRKLIRRPNTVDIQSDETCKIYLSIKIDEFGNVVGTPLVNRELTTTQSTDIITQVIQKVKSEAKYSEALGSPVEKVTVIIEVKAN